MIGGDKQSGDEQLFPEQILMREVDTLYAELTEKEKGWGVERSLDQSKNTAEAGWALADEIRERGLPRELIGNLSAGYYFNKALEDANHGVIGIASEWWRKGEIASNAAASLRQEENEKVYGKRG